MGGWNLWRPGEEREGKIWKFIDETDDGVNPSVGADV